MGTKIKATVAAAALTGAMLLAPTTAQAAPVQEAKLAGPVLTCVETSFWTPAAKTIEIGQALGAVVPASIFHSSLSPWSGSRSSTHSSSKRRTDTA